MYLSECRKCLTFKGTCGQNISFEGSSWRWEYRMLCTCRMGGLLQQWKTFSCSVLTGTGCEVDGWQQGKRSKDVLHVSAVHVLLSDVIIQGSLWAKGSNGSGKNVGIGYTLYSVMDIFSQIAVGSWSVNTSAGLFTKNKLFNVKPMRNHAKEVGMQEVCTQV